MSNKNLQSIGNTLACLGGLVVILNFTTWKDSEWGLALAVLAVVLALAGLFMINKGKARSKDEGNSTG